MSPPASRPSSPKSPHERFDAWLALRLAAWVDGVRRRAPLVVGVITAATLALLVFAGFNLRINSDNVSLVAEDLPARVNHEAFARQFPNLENGLFIVIDGRTPELAREATTLLSQSLGNQSDLFDEVYLPGGGEFFERNGLLYRSPEELDEFGDQVARIQPILAELERDPSVSNMSSLITQGLDAVGESGIEADSWSEILDRVGNATVSVYSEFPVAISWEEMLLRGSSIESVTRRIVVAHPKLDFGDFLMGRAPVERIRETARELGLTPEQGVTVRVTGNPALNYEEMIGIMWDIGAGGVICFAIVFGLLFFALRSLQLVLACVATLLVGLVWTAAFAAAAIGHLNIVSLTFAVLFIGLGVDFGIHLAMRYGELVRSGVDHEHALRGATESVGGSLVICSITTAIGFFVFVPTQYLGVAELGLIAGVGMFIILLHTLTLFPALVTCVCRVRYESVANKSFAFAPGAWDGLRRHPGAIVGGSALLGVLCLAALPQLRFDPNVIKMRNVNAESVQAFNDLLEQAGAASPWFINSVAPDLDAARERAARFRELDSVALTLTLSDYIPENQDEKLEIIEDVAFLMDMPVGAPSAEATRAISPDEQVAALRRLYEYVSTTPAEHQPSTLRDSIQVLRSRLETFLTTVERDEDPAAALASLETLLLSGLPDQVGRLRRSLEASNIAMEDLPEDLRTRMLTDDGLARIQVFPAEAMRDEASFERFVSSVMEIDPNAAGVAVNLLQFGRATRDSFQQALISAIVVIWGLLFLIWRRLSPVILATAPLVLASLLTCGFMAVFDIPFQFGNVVVIPLLLGIGVDCGIHLVHRVESLKGDGHQLMGTTTARAVFYSALTTTISFGSLAFSSHRGLASLGILLAAGMFFTVLANLVFLPALIQLRRERREANALSGTAPSRAR